MSNISQLMKIQPQAACGMPTPRAVLTDSMQRAKSIIALGGNIERCSLPLGAVASPRPMPGLMSAKAFLLRGLNSRRGGTDMDQTPSAEIACVNTDVSESSVCNDADALQTGGTYQPIVPNGFSDCVRFARTAVYGGMVQNIKIKKNGKRVWEERDETIARATMQIVQGLECGLPPMQALQLIAMINGKLTVHSEGVPALLWSKGFKIDSKFTGKGDKRRCSVTVTRPDGTAGTRSFGVDDAKIAGLWSPDDVITDYYDNEKKNDSPWHKYPDRMLYARALGFAARDIASDAMRGLWVREEAEDMTRNEAPPPARNNVVPINKAVKLNPAPRVSRSYAAQHLLQMTDVMAGCTTVDELSAIWGQHEESSPPMTHEEHSQANDIYKRARDRLAGETGTADINRADSAGDDKPGDDAQGDFSDFPGDPNYRADPPEPDLFAGESAGA